MVRNICWHGCNLGMGAIVQGMDAIVRAWVQLYGPWVQLHRAWVLLHLKSELDWIANGKWMMDSQPATGVPTLSASTSSPALRLHPPGSSLTAEAVHLPSASLALSVGLRTFGLWVSGQPGGVHSSDNLIDGYYWAIGREFVEVEFSCSIHHTFVREHDAPFLLSSICFTKFNFPSLQSSEYRLLKGNEVVVLTYSFPFLEHTLQMKPAGVIPSTQLFGQLDSGMLLGFSRF